MNTAFRPHGKFSVTVDGALMITEVTGPWNRELVAYWGQHCYRQAQLLSSAGPYVGIAVIRESMLCPPDAMEMLRQVAYLSATRLRCVAHVIVADASVEGRNFVEAEFARIYQGVVEHRIFDGLDEARRWSLEWLKGQPAP